MIASLFVGIGLLAGVASAEDRLLQQSDLIYQGAFRVPGGDFGSPTYSGFNYGGTALTYNPKNNSLFLVGHSWHQLTAEISIPELSTSANIGDLKTASVLQPFSDVTEGHRADIGAGGAAVDASGTPLGGLLVYGDKLIGTVFGYYDAGGAVKLSHFTSALNLSATGDFKGMYQVGSTQAVPNPAFIDGYMAHIPASWQAAFGGPALTGNCCLSIISRTSLGPAVSVFNPDHLGVMNPAPVTQLVGYPIGHPTLGTYGDQRSTVIYNGSMSINGVVFPQGSRSVLFFGKRGIGSFCYGAGTSDQSLDRQPVPGYDGAVIYCYDPLNGSKGGHSYPYVYQALAYDALDLLLVKNGQKSPWEISPYGVWQLSFPLGYENANILGAAYDPQTQRIYLSEGGGDHEGYSYLPLIQVYKVRTGLPSDASAPQPPKGLKFR